MVLWGGSKGLLWSVFALGSLENLVWDGDL
jgi:hypothetical protein